MFRNPPHADWADGDLPTNLSAHKYLQMNVKNFEYNWLIEIKYPQIKKP